MLIDSLIFQCYFSKYYVNFREISLTAPINSPLVVSRNWSEKEAPGTRLAPGDKTFGAATADCRPRPGDADAGPLLDTLHFSDYDRLKM